jgi:hypothetical protein
MQKINNKVLAIFDNDSNKKIIQIQNQSSLIVCGYADAGFNSTINDATVKVILKYKDNDGYLVAHKVPARLLRFLSVGTEIYKNGIKYKDFKEFRIKHNFYDIKASKFDELGDKEKSAILNSIYGEDIIKWSDGNFVLKESYFYVYSRTRISVVIPDFLLLTPYYFPDDIISNITSGLKQPQDYFYDVYCRKNFIFLKKNVPERFKHSIVLLYLYACHEEAKERQKEVLDYRSLVKAKTMQAEERFYYKFPFNLETKYIIEGEYVGDVFVAYGLFPIDFGKNVFYSYSTEFNKDVVNIDNMENIPYAGRLEKLKVEKNTENYINDDRICALNYENENNSGKKDEENNLVLDKYSKHSLDYENRNVGSNDKDYIKIDASKNFYINSFIDVLKEFKGVKNFTDLGFYGGCRVVYFNYRSKHVLVVFPVMEDLGSYVLSSKSYNFVENYRWIIREILKIRKGVSKFKNLDEFRWSSLLKKENIIFHPTQRYVGSKRRWAKRLLDKIGYIYI